MLGLWLFSVLLSGVGGELATVCLNKLIAPQCNSRENEWVEVESVVGEACGSIAACNAAQVAMIQTILEERCKNVPSCSFRTDEAFDVSIANCAAEITYNCIDGVGTTRRIPSTTSKRESDWVKDFSSWQWAVIFVIIGVVAVALIIFIVMLINKLCFKVLNNEKPVFIETTPTHSNMGSTMNSRSVSMSTLTRPPPPKKEVSAEELEEIRTQFGTARKNKETKNMKYFGADNSTLNSRRSSGDGASGEPNGKLYPGDDSSSGIGSSTFDSRLKHGLYDDTDTCHDDFVTYTMKKQAKSPLVNQSGYSTLQNPKKVDQDLYKRDAPTVDIAEDRREENFRLDINSWTLNKHGQKVQRAEPAGSSDVTVHIEAPSADIQLNPDELQDDRRIQQPRHHRPRRMGSIISIRNENLGFIPENETISTTSPTSPAADSSYGSLSLSTSGLNNDNPQRPSPTSSSKELLLDLSQLDLSMSSDQFALSKSRTQNFYEAFGTPRTVVTDRGTDSTDASGIPQEYPNTSLPPQVAPETISKDTKKDESSDQKGIGLSPPEEIFVPKAGSTKVAKHFKKSEDFGTSTRVKYHTQLKLGESLRPGKKNKKRFNPKGTVHYAFRSDVQLAEP